VTADKVLPYLTEAPAVLRKSHKGLDRQEFAQTTLPFALAGTACGSCATRVRSLDQSPGLSRRGFFRKGN